MALGERRRYYKIKYLVLEAPSGLVGRKMAAAAGSASVVPPTSAPSLCSTLPEMSGVFVWRFSVSPPGDRGTWSRRLR